MKRMNPKLHFIVMVTVIPLFLASMPNIAFSQTSEISEDQNQEGLVEEYEWFEKGLYESMKQAERQDQIRFVQEWIIPITLIPTIATVLVILIRRKSKIAR